MAWRVFLTGGIDSMIKYIDDLDETNSKAYMDTIFDVFVECVNVLLRLDKKDFEINSDLNFLEYSQELLKGLDIELNTCESSTNNNNSENKKNSIGKRVLLRKKENKSRKNNYIMQGRKSLLSESKTKKKVKFKNNENWFKLNSPWGQKQIGISI